jgi:very-short-patch-repair endonuclease
VLACGGPGTALLGYQGAAAPLEADRARDAHLTALGYRVIRVTWRQMEQPAALAHLLRELLLK